jgi:hypothetical protein
MVGFRMETVDIFYSQLEYFTAILYTFWSFGNVATIWYFFTVFGILCREKSGNPAQMPSSSGFSFRKRNVDENKRVRFQLNALICQK